MDPKVDPLIGADVETNPFSVEGKIVSIDVYAQNKSILFGVSLGVRQRANSQEFALTGEWLPNSPLHQNAWRQVLCDASDMVTHYDGARSVSKLRNVQWGDPLASEAMRQLRDTSKRHGGQLAISLTLYDFSYNPSVGNFSYGRVSGTIGLARRGEPRFFEGERLLSFEYVDQPHLTWPKDDSCSRDMFTEWRPFWAYRAPFKLHPDKRVLTVDFSNSFARNLHGGVRNLGDLFLGVLRSLDGRQICVDLIDTIDYHADRCQKENSCVMDYSLDRDLFDLVQKRLLVVVRPRQKLPWTTTTFPLCVAPILSILNRRWSRHSYDMVIMMMESKYYIRPFHHYTFFMEKDDIALVDFFVTSLGKPVRGKTVKLKIADPEVRPLNGVTFNRAAATNSNGHARFVFIANSVGYPRRPIDLDGQVYQFLYHIEGEPMLCHDEVKIAKGTGSVEATCTDAVTLKIFSDIQHNNGGHPFTWVDHVEPIFSQYSRLYPEMKKVVDLGSYEDATKPRIIHLLNFTMLLDINHPNYMPVSRDLSASKRKMILEWLARPCYNSTHCLLNSTTSTGKDHTLVRGSNAHIKHTSTKLAGCEGMGDFRQQPRDSENYFVHTASIDTTKFGVAQQESTNCFEDLEKSQCSVVTLQHCLQKALELEFYTIPLYLTALYSIKDGHNQKVRSLIRSVVMQEMLHLLQVANLLLSIGGKPKIDSLSSAPRYPTIGLPGGVLPQLEVSLQRASLTHIQKVFMAIEYPHKVVNTLDNVDVVHKQTIGQFYHEIRNCFVKRGDGIFFPNRTLLQTIWPFSNDYGSIYVVKDLATAVKAINEIVEQGEGMQPGDPRSYRREDLAHFFKFQEIVCGRELEFHAVSNYSFTGPLIPFDEKGVWPMKDNPRREELIPGSYTYNQAVVFHETYRSLLRKLDQVFGGKPDGIADAMAIMESLGLQAKNLMVMPARNRDDQTCGPIFDYEWS